MVIKEEESERRLNNPLNLINRLKGGMTPIAKRSSKAMDLFVPQGSPASESGLIKPSIPASVVIIPSDKQTTSDDVIDDADGKIKLALAHDDALSLLTSSIASLKHKVENDGIKPSALPSIIGAASKVVSEIRRERLEREKAGKEQDVHIHFYCPTQRKVAEYEIIDVAS